MNQEGLNQVNQGGNKVETEAAWFNKHLNRQNSLQAERKAENPGAERKIIHDLLIIYGCYP